MTAKDHIHNFEVQILHGLPVSLLSDRVNDRIEQDRGPIDHIGDYVESSPAIFGIGLQK